MRSDNYFMKKLSSLKPLKLVVQVSLICGLTLVGISSSFATPENRAKAKRMHDHLAGIPPTEQVLCAMEFYIDSNNAEQAARIVMDTSGSIPDPNTCNNGDPIDNSLSRKAFYSVSLKNFVTPWTNEEQTVHADLNDYSATVIGMIRDDVPFDTVLSADLIYKGTSGNPSNANNNHYKALQDSDADLSDSSVLTGVKQTEITNYLPANPSDDKDIAKPAGVTTTRAASFAFFTGGTNRLMWRMTAVNYLCRDMEQLKDVSRPNDRIRQDVSRSPGGDSSIYLSSCMGCHAGMDPLAGAYAYYDHYVDSDGNPDLGMLWKQNSLMFGGKPAATVEQGIGETQFNQNCLGSNCHTLARFSSSPPDAAAIQAAIDSQSQMSNVSRNLNFDAIAAYLLNPTAQTAVAVEVTAKYLINSGNFKYGYVTKSDQWTNYWREGPNSDMEWGWRESQGLQRTVEVTTPNVLPDGTYETKPFNVPPEYDPNNPAERIKISSSYGAASLGYEVTSTKAFAQCQVEKVYKFVCLHEPRSGDAGAIDAIVESMPTDSPPYSMKNVFAKVAPMCMDKTYP